MFCTGFAGLAAPRAVSDDCRQSEGEKGCAVDAAVAEHFRRRFAHYFHEPRASGRHFQQSGRCASGFSGLGVVAGSPGVSTFR